VKSIVLVAAVVVVEDVLAVVLDFADVAVPALAGLVPAFVAVCCGVEGP
jgi:hypothetical protein